MKTKLIAFTLTAFPGAAFAAAEYAPFAGECGSDADCGEGMVCEVTGASGCDCAVPEGSSGDRESCSCDPVEYRSCVPGPCQSNADCGAGLVCATYEQPCASTATPCTPDGYCPEPPPCEATTVSVCAPQWVLPCETAADCGTGFTCEASEICTCSAGTSSGEVPAQGGGSDGGAPQDALPEPPQDPETSCTCEPTGTNHCVAVEVACDDASACPAGWTCERMVYDTPCTSTEPAEGGGAEFAPPDDAEKVPCGAPEPAPSQGVCYPPHSVDFDAGIPRGDDSATPQYEAGTANGVPVSTESPEGTTPGQKDTGCGGGAASVGGLALLMVALWRRRLAA